MTRVCVFCGSRRGAGRIYAEAAVTLGRLLAQEGLGLVYGGASLGLMGVLADAALAAGGAVIGVMPRGLMAKEIAHDGLTELRVVGSMHERKALMVELADAFVALPGGYGTLEEFCEVVTWAQLGLHRKPCGLLNVGGYYNHLLAHFDHQVAEGFLTPLVRSLVLSANCPSTLLTALRDHRSPLQERWMTSDQT